MVPAVALAAAAIVVGEPRVAWAAVRQVGISMALVVVLGGAVFYWKQRRFHRRRGGPCRDPAADAAEQGRGLSSPMANGFTRPAAAFDWDVAIGVMLAASSALYAVGLARLWREAGVGRGVRPLRAGCFAAGIAALILALLSPLDALSDVLFSAHMGQHEILMPVAAPLLVMGKPWLTAMWALPARSRPTLGALARRPIVRASWRWITGPVTILSLHALALWIWHIPWLFEGALENETVHAFQHLCFFVTAALFWWSLSQGRYGRAGYGAGVAFVFITALHSGILGALITFAGRLWYPIYEARTRAAGGDPLADQQLAGLFMWIPAGVLLMVVGLAFLAAWLGDSERRARRADVELERRLVSRVDGAQITASAAVAPTPTSEGTPISPPLPRPGTSV